MDRIRSVTIFLTFFQQYNLKHNIVSLLSSEDMLEIAIIAGSLITIVPECRTSKEEV